MCTTSQPPSLACSDQPRTLAEYGKGWRKLVSGQFAARCGMPSTSSTACIIFKFRLFSWHIQGHVLQATYRNQSHQDAMSSYKLRPV
eukprot:6199490-Pleurochrysis_carterae.AAC.2